MKTAVTLALVGVVAALPCAAIAETWADDVRSAYDATRPSAPGMELAMLTPEEAEHIRGIVAEEVSANITAQEAPQQAIQRVIHEYRSQEDGMGMGERIAWGAVIVGVVAVVSWALVKIAEEIEGDTVNNGGTWNQGNGTQDNSQPVFERE